MASWIKFQAVYWLLVATLAGEGNEARGPDEDDDDEDSSLAMEVEDMAERLSAAEPTAWDRDVERLTASQRYM